MVLGTSAARAQEAPIFREKPCDIPVVSGEVAARLRCGSVVVPRDTQAPAAGIFDLAVVVRRSVKPRPGAAPVLLLHGGPGGEMTRYLGQSPGDFFEGRDTVAFDMRGGGRSTPRVCEGQEAKLAAARKAGLSGASLRVRQQEIVRGCLAEWKAAGLAAPQFGTARSVEDAEAIRRALGVSRWILNGVSYGTVVAGHYVAAHPGVIEAAVLDSLYPPDDLLRPVDQAQRGLLERLARECQEDPRCRARLDFSVERAEAAIAGLEADPLVVPVRGGSVRLDGRGLRGLLHGVAQTEAGARGIPFLIGVAAARSAATLAPLLDIPEPGQGGAPGEVNLAAALATDCRDRARHHRDGGLDALEVVAGLPPGACTGWGEPGEAPRLPEGTAVPMLLLSGGYDAFQPDTAAVARRIGPAARHLEIPFASHVVRGSGVCARQIVGAWVDAPTAAPATTCLARASAPPFLLAVDVIPAVPRLMGQAGGPPAAALLGLGGVTVASAAGLLWPAGAALVSRLRRRASPRIAGTGWAALAALAALVSVLGLIGAVALAFQEERAALAFGLPAGWGSTRWLLVPGVVCALGAVWAAFRGRSWRVGLTGGGALVAFCAQAVLGLAPLPLRCCRGCVRAHVPGDRGAFREATERVHWAPSFMKIPFPRTARWMQDDQTPLPRPVLALLMLLSVGWGAWFFLGSVKVYAVSQVARTEVDTMAHGVQTPVAGVVTENRLRLGQRVEEGQVLLVLDSTAERLQLVQEQARRAGLQRTVESMKRQLDAEKAAVQAQQREASAAAQAAFARGRAARTVSDQASEEDKLIQQLRGNALATGLEAMKSASEARRQSTEAAASSLEASRIAAQGQVGVADRMIQVLRLEHQLTGLQNDLDISDATMGRLQFEIERKTLRAVVSGSVADLSPVPVGSTLDQGQKVAVVVPEGSHRVVARFSPSEAVGRVKPGQQGIVRLDAFPWTEYGVLRIQVGQLAHEPQEGLVRAELLVHGKNDAIPLGHGLTGSVEIELEELPPARLLLRSAGQLMAPAATPPPSPPQTSSPSARLP